MARRFGDTPRAFDKTHPLAQAIMNGWTERSPVDCLVISPELELKGALTLNEYLHHGRDGSRTTAENYRLFLIEALVGKQPGLRSDNSFTYLLDDVDDNTPNLDSPFKPFLTDLNVILNPTQPTLEVLDILRMSETGSEDSTIVKIDATAFEKGGILTIDIRVGSTELSGSFYLYDSDIEFPAECGLRYYHSFANARDVPPGETAQITYPFYRGQVFKLVIAAAERVDNKASVNAFQARVSVMENYSES